MDQHLSFQIRMNNKADNTLECVIDQAARICFEADTAAARGDINHYSMLFESAKQAAKLAYDALVMTIAARVMELHDEDNKGKEADSNG